jgi:RNA polymerase sigma-70 factor (ECF subfamily)
MLDDSLGIRSNDESQVTGVLSAGSASQHARVGPARTGENTVPTESPMATLVARMALGQQEALASLYDETCSLLNGLLLRMLERPEDAEEALADVYMKAWKNAASYSPDRGSVQSWLVIMARSIAIDRIRHKRAQPKMAALEFESGVDLKSHGATPEEQTGASQRRTQVQRVLLDLPPEQRQVLVMAFFGGLSHSELASKLGQPLGTVKSRIRTALLRLKDVLEEGTFS